MAGNLSYVGRGSDAGKPLFGHTSSSHFIQSHGKDPLEWQTTPVFLHGKFPGQRSLTSYSPWGPNKLYMIECTHTHTHMCTYTHMHTHTHSFEPFIFIFADIFFLLKHFSLFYISSRKKIERKNYFTLWLSWSFCKQQPDGILHWLPTLISWALTPPPLELGNGGMNLLSDNVAIK